jgi:hypothetical protein
MIIFTSNSHFDTALLENDLSFEKFAEKCSKPNSSTSKAGACLFPAHYIRPHRKQELIDYYNFIMLDIDDSEAAFDLLGGHKLEEFPFNFIMYSTFSSTIEKPRLRILVEVAPNEILIDDYRAAVRTVANMLNTVNDPSSAAINNLGYLPNVCPSGHYEFMCATNRRPFTKEDTDERFYRSQKRDALDSLSKDEDTDYETVASMVNCIIQFSPEIADDYKTWLDILMALHHYSNGSAEGFELAKKFSAVSRKYEGESALRDKWESFGREENHITIGTLFFYANKCGWAERRQADFESAFNQKIIDLGPELKLESIADTLAKELSIPYISGAARLQLLGALVEQTLKARFPKGAVNGEIKKILEARLRKLANPFCHNTANGKVTNPTPFELRNLVIVTRVHSTPHFLDIDAPLSSSRPMNTISQPDFDQEFRHLKEHPKQSPSRLVFEGDYLPICKNISLAPGKPSVFVDDGEKCANLFVKDETFLPTPRHRFNIKQTEVYEQFDTFMEYFSPNKQHRRILLNFLAHCVFEPGHKIPWAPYIMTSEGYGKGLLMHLFSAALGKHARYYRKVPGEKFFDEQWTNYLEGKYFLYVDEIYFSGIKKIREIFNKKKSCFTDSSDVVIESKGINARYVKQVINYALTTNEKSRIPCNTTERRLFVMDPERYHSDYEQSKQDILPSFDFLFNLCRQVRLATEQGTYSRDVKELRQALLSYFYEYYLPDNRDSDFKINGEALKTEEFFELSELGKDHASEVASTILTDEKNINWANRYYVLYRPFVDAYNSATDHTRLREPVKADSALYESGYSKLGKTSQFLKREYSSNYYLIAKFCSHQTTIYLSKQAEQALAGKKFDSVKDLIMRLNRFANEELQREKLEAEFNESTDIPLTDSPFGEQTNILQ